MTGRLAPGGAGRGPTSDPRVVALRQFLIHQGYHIPATGDHIGHLMQSALDDWHKGVGKRNPIRWSAHQNLAHDTHRAGPNGADAPDSVIIKRNVQRNAAHDPTRAGPHGIDIPKTPKQKAAAGIAGTHPGPTHKVPANSPQGHPHPQAGGGGGGGGKSFTGMLAGLLKHSGTADQIPLSLADQIASPDSAAAKAVQSEIDQLPSAKKAALKNIADWYGQVQNSEKTASGRDKAMADSGASAVSDNAKGIMASLGGSALAGSGSIGAMGANDAATLSALGANDASLASDLAPIFDLVRADAGNKTQQQFQAGKLSLENNLAAAQGQEAQDRANAIMQILQANNQSRQTNFSNRSGLLNTLAGLQISGANAASEAQSRAIMNAFHVSEIQKNSAKQSNGLAAMTPQQRADFVQKIVGGLVDPNTKKLSYDWPTALRNARNYVRSAGFNPMNKQVENIIIGPALAQAGITAKGGGYWPAIYQP